MSSNYFSKRIERCITHLNVGLDVKELKEYCSEILENLQDFQFLDIFLFYMIPNEQTDYIQSAITDNMIKSHEIEALLYSLHQRISNALSKWLINYNKIIKKIPLFRNRIRIHFSSKEARFKNTLRTILEIHVSVREAFKFTTRQVFSFIKIFLDDPVQFSDKIVLKIDAILRNGSLNDNQKNQNKNISWKKSVSRISGDDRNDYLTLEDKELIHEYYSHPEIKNLIFEYFFPLKTDNIITRITLDKLQDRIPVKKSLRINFIANEYHKIIRYFTPNLSLKTFISIIKKNEIAGFYAGTSDIKGELKYLVFDLDLSSFLKNACSEQATWDFLLEVSRAIIRVIKFFGVKGYPLVKFSGANGIHIIYRLEKGLISDVNKRLNLENYFYSFPGMWELLKNKRSVMKSKSSFMRLIADAFCTAVIYMTAMEIPYSISTLFEGPIQLNSLLKISIHDANEIAVLMDTSPNGSGVFRTGFSIHPSSKLVSIPIYDSSKGEFIPEYLDFANLKKEASIQSVLEHVQKKDELYQYYSQMKNVAIIHKKDLVKLLQPHRLLPYMAFVLRFSRRYVTRSRNSFLYWKEYYELKYLFEYLEHQILHCKEKEKAKVLKTIFLTIQGSNLVLKKQLFQIILEHLLKKRLSPLALKEYLQGIYHFEFYYRISPTPLILEDTRVLRNPNKLFEFILDPIRRREFLDRTYHVQLIINFILSWNFRMESKVPVKRKLVIYELSHLLTEFLEVINKLSLELKEHHFNSGFKSIISFMVLIKYYNLLINFLNKYFRFIRISCERNENRIERIRRTEKNSF